MANEKRLIDANALTDDTYILNSWDAPIVRAWLDDQPTVDAVEMPKGKPGDYVKWDSGVREWLWEIKAVVICKDSIRYDLGGICPVVNHRNIRGILSREEAEAELAKMDGGNEDG